MHLGVIKTKKTNVKIFIGFGIAAVVLVAAVIYFAFSSATIAIYPKALSQEVVFSANVDQNPELDPRKIETISGRILTAEKDGSKDINDVSKKTLEERATATIQLVNTTSKSQPLLANTQLTTSNGVIFRTNARAVVPAHGSVNVGVTADVAGADGNIQPQRLTIVKLFKGLQSQIYGVLGSAITNGTREAQVATQNDIDTAKASLADSLYNDLNDELTKQLKPGEKIIPDATRNEILTFTSSVAAGATTTQFHIDEHVRVTAVVFDESSLLELAEAKLKTQIPSGRELVNPSTDQLTYAVPSYDINKGTAELKVTFKGTTIVKLGSEIFDKTKLFGLSKQETIDYFAQYPDIEKVNVSFFPFWISKIPNIEGKIQIQIAKDLTPADSGK